MLELIVAIPLLATLALAMAQIFRATMAANLRTATEATALQAARIAMDGNGPYHGFVFDTYFSSAVYSIGASSMTLLESDQSTTAYQVVNSTLTASNSANGAIADMSPAANIGSLTFNFYTVGSNFLISTTTTPSAATFVTMSFQVPRSQRTLQFFTGSAIGNDQLR
jgi:hypothetical protein